MGLCSGGSWFSPFFLSLHECMRVCFVWDLGVVQAYVCMVEIMVAFAFLVFFVGGWGGLLLGLVLELRGSSICALETSVKNIVEHNG